MRSTWLCFALLSAAVGGCGDDTMAPPSKDMSVGDDMTVPDMGIPDDAKKLVTFTMFAQDYAQHLCALYMKCGQLDAAQMAACIERNLQHTGWDQDVEITKGRMEINELQCLDALDQARCDFSDAVAWQSRCQQFLYVPHQANGASCLASLECTSGYCRHAGSDAGVGGQATGCPGTCADPNPPGGTCRLDSDCQANYFCDNGQCSKLAALNEACQAVFASAPDTTKPLCQFGLNCPTFPSTMPAKCVMPTQANLNGACDPYQGLLASTPPCAAGAYCQVQYDASSMPTGGVCKMKLAAGADCNPNNEGSFVDFGNSQCADGTLCFKLPSQAKATCQPYGSANDDCFPFSGTVSTCKQGLWCDYNGTKKCKPLLADGQACAENRLCPSALPQQLTCIADNADAGGQMTCQPAKSFGATCIPGFEDSLCAPTDFPSTSTCVPTGGGSGVCAPKCY
jgi:hypothetical protein